MSEGRKLIFRLGDMVRIKSGPFAAFTGKIDGINQAKALLKVNVKIFGNTMVKVGFSEVEKLEFLQSPPPPSSQQN